MMSKSNNNLSGDWIGYYNYGDYQPPHTMEMYLSVEGSAVSGRGMDDVGKFIITGTRTGENISWTKSYAAHQIEYSGSFEGKRIWGTWEQFFSGGGFMIWPRKADGEKTEEKEKNIMTRAVSRHLLRKRYLVKTESQSLVDYVKP